MHSHFMFAICILFTALAVSPLVGQEPQRFVNMAKVEAGNFLTYRGAVREYILDNPGYTGTIAEPNLDLPGTYNNMGWSNQAASGEAWIFGDMAPGGLKIAVEKMDQPVNLGRNKNGVLESPVHGNTGIAVPGFVPSGQVAAVIANP